MTTGLIACSACGTEFCGNCIVTIRDNPYCARCKVEYVKDLKSGIDPSKVEYASLFSRFWALAIDLAVFYAMIVPVVLVLLLIFGIEVFERGDPPPGFIIPLFLAEVTLPVAYESLMLASRGQTLGKRVARIKVVTPEGEDITRRQAWVRTICKLVLAMPYGLTFAFALLNKERKTLHDMIAKTRVVFFR